jgi:hypothetical protein
LIPPPVATHLSYYLTKVTGFRHRGSESLLEAAMDRFVSRQNVERYRRLREARNAAERRQILRSLAKERAEFKLEFRSVDPSSVFAEIGVPRR